MSEIVNELFKNGLNIYVIAGGAVGVFLIFLDIMKQKTKADNNFSPTQKNEYTQTNHPASNDNKSAIVIEKKQEALLAYEKQKAEADKIIEEARIAREKQQEENKKTFSNDWTCPNCKATINENYLRCACGYIREVTPIVRSETTQTTIEKKEEEANIAREKQKEENKKILQGKLGELKSLLDEGIITEDEHTKRRQVVLDKFFYDNEKIAQEIERLANSSAQQQTDKPLVDEKIPDAEAAEKQAGIEEPSREPQHSKPKASTQPSPPFVKSNPSNTVKRIDEKKTMVISSKSWIIGIIIAAILNGMATALSGSHISIGSVGWTAVWMSLSVEAWRYWVWKALFPYPMFWLASGISGLILEAIGVQYLSLPYGIAKGALNICGLIIFYRLVSKAKTEYE